MSANGKEYELAIRISGIVDKNFNTSLVKANTKLAKFKAQVSAMNSDFSTLDKGFNSVMKTGQKCFSAIATAAGVAAVAIGAATVGAIAVGTEFESAFAGVKKTVEATEEEYAKLRQDILDMAKVLPSSASEIAGVMEIAGQLGIANESLANFTETMINLGVSTNMAAEDAANFLSRFANITKMADYDEKGISNFERLGSVIVDLGNNFATTEEEIVTMGTNIAAAGDLVGLSEAQIMALATAMSSTGIKAEKGGSAMSKLLKKMQLAIETNSESLADYARVSGMTGEQFATTFKEDAVVALSAFIDGLNNTERNGKSAIATLDEMGLSEVRLSDVILRLANSGGIMTEAIEMANTAWEENTALQIEAGKRYETTESKLKLLRNAFQDLGIAAYDELQGPFTKVLGNITDKVNEFSDYVGGPDGISKWLKNISTELPTMQRKVKSAWKVVEPFFEGLLGIGKWFLKNPDVIVGAIAGIGAALASYKIASTLVHIVNALMSFATMNPVTLGIMGVVTAIGLLVGAIATYKAHQKELVDKSLQEHFGNIALSMEDIQTIAKHIVSSDSLGGVKEALEAFEDLDGISSTMENAISEIDKMNWKVSIGMELTPDEQEQYKTAISDYVANAQEYVQQAQYAVSLNLSTTSGDADVIAKVNQFYADSYEEMVSLGEDLSAAVNDAFSDKILDPDEIVAISEIQAKMAELQESLAVGEFDAQLSILGMEYSGANLTADSFKNLQTELAAQTAEAAQAYKDSYAKNYASIQAAYDAGDYLNDEEYNTALEDLQNEYLDNIRAVEERAANFQLNTIMDTYGEDINAIFKKYNTLTGQPLYEAIMGDGDFDATRGALAELLELMEPTVKQIGDLAQQYEEAGKIIPPKIQGIIEKYSILSEIAGDGNAILSIDNLPGRKILPPGAYAGLDIASKYFSEHGDIFGGISSGLSDAAAGLTAGIINDSAETTIRPAVEGMYAWSQEAIDEYYKKGFDTEADVNIKLTPRMSGITSRSLFNFNIDGINQRADGGLATRPELTWFAEKGPEMAIPIDGSQNAISLWEQTGRLLGMDSRLDGLTLDGSPSATIEYSPTLQFYGDAPSKEDIEDALRLSQDEFDSLFDKYLKNRGRMAFG